MEAYRDQYASVFRGGRGVTLIGVSNDPAEELSSWARDADFPFLFGHDDNGAAVRAFGGEVRGDGMTLERAVVVIGPDGKIAKWMTPFREIDPSSYEELRVAIAAVAPALDDF
jgi:thioredoxin-dependent peroxiredoxin